MKKIRLLSTTFLISCTVALNPAQAAGWHDNSDKPTIELNLDALDQLAPAPVSGSFFPPPAHKPSAQPEKKKAAPVAKTEKAEAKKIKKAEKPTPARKKAAAPMPVVHEPAPEKIAERPLAKKMEAAVDAAIKPPVMPEKKPEPKAPPADMKPAESSVPPINVSPDTSPPPPPPPAIMAPPPPPPVVPHEEKVMEKPKEQPAKPVAEKPPAPVMPPPPPPPAMMVPPPPPPPVAAMPPPPPPPVKEEIPLEEPKATVEQAKPLPQPEPEKPAAPVELIELPKAPVELPDVQMLKEKPATIPEAPKPPAEKPAVSEPVETPHQAATEPADATAKIMALPVNPELGTARLSIGFKSTETAVPLSVTGDLDKIAKELKGNESLRVTLIAYASSSGTQASTVRRVSLARALAVRAYLIDQGIGNLRINVQAEGDKNPGGDPDRVDIFIQNPADKK